MVVAGRPQRSSPAATGLGQGHPPTAKTPWRDVQCKGRCMFMGQVPSLAAACVAVNTCCIGHAPSMHSVPCVVPHAMQPPAGTSSTWRLPPRATPPRRRRRWPTAAATALSTAQGAPHNRPWGTWPTQSRIQTQRPAWTAASWMTSTSSGTCCCTRSGCSRGSSSCAACSRTAAPRSTGTPWRAARACCFWSCCCSRPLRPTTSWRTALPMEPLPEAPWGTAGSSGHQQQGWLALAGLWGQKGPKQRLRQQLLRLRAPRPGCWRCYPTRRSGCGTRHRPCSEVGGRSPRGPAMRHAWCHAGLALGACA